MSESFFVEVFGEENLERFSAQQIVLNDKQDKLDELAALNDQFSSLYRVQLSFSDLLVATCAGVLLGLANALFKGYIPKSGKFKHKHTTTRTAVDYQVPKPEGYKGSVQDLHRQLGPSHDIFRFKEAVALMSGERTDFKLWGSTATKILGHELKPGNLSLADFRRLGGFRIPADPKAELIHHLMIDFFTKRSLPIPGTTYIADHSPDMAKIMFGMYDQGFNLKTGLGNLIGFLLVELILRGYVFLFKAVPQSGFSLANLNVQSLKELFTCYNTLTKENEFHVLMMLAHGASALTDALVSLGTKSYAGLFQLNFLSLGAFAKHLVAYLVQNAKQGKQQLQEIRAKHDEILIVDASWYAGFRQNVAIAGTNSNFVSLFNPDEWSQSSQRIDTFKHNLEAAQRRRNELLSLLED